MSDDFLALEIFEADFNRMVAELGDVKSPDEGAVDPNLFAAGTTEIGMDLEDEAAFFERVLHEERALVALEERRAVRGFYANRT